MGIAFALAAEVATAVYLSRHVIEDTIDGKIEKRKAERDDTSTWTNDTLGGSVG